MIKKVIKSFIQPAPARQCDYDVFRIFEENLKVAYRRGQVAFVTAKKHGKNMKNNFLKF